MNRHKESLVTSPDYPVHAAPAYPPDRRAIRHDAARRLWRHRGIVRRLRAGLYAAGLAQLRQDAEVRLVRELTITPHPADPYPVLTHTGALRDDPSSPPVSSLHRAGVL